MPGAPLPQSPLEVALAQKIRAEVNSRTDVSHLEVSRRIGRSPSQVTKMLTGQAKITVTEAELLCEAVGWDFMATMESLAHPASDPSLPIRVKSEARELGDLSDRVGAAPSAPGSDQDEEPERLSCHACGAVVVDWRRHEAFHERIGDLPTESDQV